MRFDNKILAHDEAMALLPWLANGSLSEAESSAVLQHARQCLACRREAKYLERVNGIFADSADAAVVPAANLKKILRRIEEYEDRRERKVAMRLWRFFQRYRRAAVLAPGAAAMLILAVVLWPGAPEPQFTTLTQVEDLPPGNYMRTVFDPLLDEPEVVELVAALNLRIVAGPSANRVYTLVPGRQLSSAEFARVAETLRANPEVLFAEPIRVGVAP